MIRNNKDIGIVLRYIGFVGSNAPDQAYMYGVYNTESGEQVLILSETLLEGDDHRCVTLSNNEPKGTCHDYDGFVDRKDLTDEELSYVSNIISKHKNADNEMLDLFAHRGLVGSIRNWFRRQFDKASGTTSRERNKLTPMPQRKPPAP